MVNVLNGEIQKANSLSTSDHAHDQYMSAVRRILNLGALLVSKILTRKSGQTGMKIVDFDSSDNCLLLQNYLTPISYTDDLIIYYMIDPGQFSYSSYFSSQPGSGQEYMQAVTCSYSSDTTGFDKKRPLAGVIYFNYLNIFGPNFMNNGPIFNIDSYSKLAAKAILQIMGLNLNATNYWLDSSGQVYQNNPIQQVQVTSDGVTHYSINTPSILAFANSYFNPTTPVTSLILGTYTHPEIQYVTMEMHLAPEDLISELNLLSFYYVVSGFTLAAINDMGWYQVYSSVQQPLTFANSVPSSFLNDVQSQADLISKYPDQFSNNTPSPDKCYFAYGKMDVIPSRSTVFLPQKLLLYKQLCQRSDGQIPQTYFSYTPTSGCFISDFPNSNKQYICLERSCYSSNSMVSVTLQDAQTTCNTENQLISGIKALNTQTSTYSLQCPSKFNLYCTSEMPCQNNCSQNGICLHNFCQCQPTYIGLYCEMSCLPLQWYDALSKSCVNSCPTGYYGNVSKNRQCDKCPTADCLDDCPDGQYRASGQTQCSQCPYQCSKCTSDTYCTDCKIGFQLNNNQCICTSGTFNPTINQCVTCSSNQYFDVQTSLCKQCDTSCKTCQTQATQCTSCNSPSALYNFTCLPSCPDQFFANASNICQACSSNCKTCKTSSSTCLTCYDTFQLLPDSSCGCVNQVLDTSTNKCISCNSNQIFDPNNKICQNCSSNCLTCKDLNNLSTCTSCQVGKVLYNGQCQDSCPSQYYKDSNNVCQACDPLCKDCQTSSKYCISCNSPLQLSGSTCVCQTGFYDATNKVCKTCTLNQVPDYTNQKCVDCNTSCKTCQDISNLSKCTSCTAPYALYTNFCYNPCPSGYYADSNQVCQSCNSSCLTCESNSTKCTSCPSTFQLSNDQCVCPSNTIYDSSQKICISCQLNQAIDIPNQKCQNCNTSCRTCQDKDNLNTCTTCYSGKVLYNNTCIDQCPDSTFQDQYNTCQPCNSMCKTCIDLNSKCTSCNSPLKLNVNSCQCDSGFYNSSTNQCVTCTPHQVPNNAQQVCQNCDVNCLGCQDINNLDKCTSCYSPYVLYQQKCYNNCPVGYYPDTNLVCQPCDSSCQSCSNTSTYCTSCPNTFTLSNNKCICQNSIYDSQSKTCKQCTQSQILDQTNNVCSNCDLKCLTCQDLQNLSTCTSCPTGKILYNSTCIDQCPEQTYLLNNICLPCNSNCKTCQTSSTNCTSCESPLTLTGSVCQCSNGNYNPFSKQCIQCTQSQVYDSANYQCLDCNQTCLTCQDKDNLSKCTSCPQNFILYNSQCLNTCPDQKYFSNNTCLPCDSNCKTCQVSSTQCTSCNSPLELQSSNTCKCPQGNYNPNNNTCVVCSSNQVYDSINYKCLNCNSNCLTCKDKDNLNTCTSCQTPLVLSNGTCIIKCLDTQYQSNNTCLSCDSNCKTCQVQSTQCTSCNSPLELQSSNICKCASGNYNPNNNTCVVCSSNQVYDSTSYQCLNCNSNCLTCKDKDNLNTCTSCQTPFVLSSGSCITKCLDTQYQSNNTCLSCDSNCKTCQVSSTQCTSCNSPLELQASNTCKCSSGNYNPSNNTCVVCSSNQVYDSINYKCLNCNSNCLTCKDKDNLNTCTSCQTPLVLSNGSCITKCLDTQYQSNNSCLPCDSNCKTCQVSSSQCTSCNSPLELQASNTCKCPQGNYNPNNNTCVVCSSNQVYDSINYKCLNCNSNCLTCKDKDSLNTCTSCQTPLVLSSGSCISQCLDTQYLDSNSVCQNCDANCVTCKTQSTNCLTCKQTFTLKDNKCVCLNSYDSVSNTCKDCTSKQILDPDTKKCIDCNPSCLTCQAQGVQPNICTSCSPPMILYNSQCLSSCPPKMYYDSNLKTCKQCDSNCLECQGSSTTCTACNSPFVAQNGVCVCANGQYFKDGVCYQNCPPGTFKNNIKMTCDSCYSSCLSCKNSSQDSCTSCQTGYALNSLGVCILSCPSNQYPYQNLSCLPCPSSCASCLNPQTCTSCVAPMLFYNNGCIPSCPQGFENHYGNCIPTGSCDKSCIKCDSDSNCIECPTDKYIQGKICVSDCESGYYKLIIAGTCKPCYKGCQKCTGSNEVDCSDYKPPKKDNSASYKCHKSCQACVGPSYDQCTSCSQNRKLNKYYRKEIGTCVCNSGYTDYLLGPCTAYEEPSLIKTSAISSVVINAAVVFVSSSPTAFLFLIDAQQTISYFRYLNMNKPLNFDQQIKPLYYSHVIPFLPNVSKDWLPSFSDSSSNGSQSQVSNARNLQNQSSQTSSNLSLDEGNNRISDNQKYPFFLINAFIIIIIQIVFWVICWVMQLVVRYKILTPKVEKLINIFRYNAVLIVIYITMSELSLLTFYHFTVMSWETNLEIVSSLMSIVSLLYIIGLIMLLINVTIKQREQNINQEKFYILFGIFKEKHIMRKIIASAIYAFAYPSHEAQGILMILLYLPYWAYMISRNPFASTFAKIASVITESFMLFCHLYFLTLSLSDNANDIIGSTDLLMILILATLIAYSILGGLAFIVSIYLKIKNYKQRRFQIAKIYPQQITQNSQRGIIEKKKQDNQSKISYKDEDQLSDLSITQPNVTQTPLKTNQDQSNFTMLNNSHSIQQQSVQDMSISYNNKLINTSQNQQFNTRQFDIIDEQSNDDDDLSSAQRYQAQHDEKPKSYSQDNDEQLEFSFRSKLEGIKEQENEDGSLQFSDAASLAQRKKFVS